MLQFPLMEDLPGPQNLVHPQLNLIPIFEKDSMVLYPNLTNNQKLHNL